MSPRSCLQAEGCITKKVTPGVRTAGKMHQRFIALDTETTGLSSSRGRMIEIGACLFEDGKLVREFSTLINPGMPIPPGSTAIHHITDAMVADAPEEKEACLALIEFMEDAIDGNTVLVAHNASFDMGFLRAAFERNQLPATIFYADTCSLARKWMLGLPNYKQQTIETYLGLQNDQAHRALSDARICGQIFLELLSIIEKSKQ